jgi:hypothetical protein
LAKIIGCGAGSRQGKSTEIEDDPVPCPVCPRNRLCIPLCEGEYGEVYIFKTPYHEDFKNDLHESMVHVGLATSAAPTYYRPRQAGGYTFVDGGVWSNNPTMIALRRHSHPSISRASKFEFSPLGAVTTRILSAAAK